MMRISRQWKLGWVFLCNRGVINYTDYPIHQLFIPGIYTTHFHDHGYGYCKFV